MHSKQRKPTNLRFSLSTPNHWKVDNFPLHLFVDKRRSLHSTLLFGTFYIPAVAITPATTTYFKHIICGSVTIFRAGHWGADKSPQSLWSHSVHVFLNKDSHGRYPAVFVLVKTHISQPFFYIREKDRKQEGFLDSIKWKIIQEKKCRKLLFCLFVSVWVTTLLHVLKNLNINLTILLFSYIGKFNYFACLFYSLLLKPLTFLPPFCPNFVLFLLV